jgi:hypothetical protein
MFSRRKSFLANLVSEVKEKTEQMGPSPFSSLSSPRQYIGIYYSKYSNSTKKMNGNRHYCLTDLSVDSNDITALVSGEQKHYFHLWGLQKPLVAFATRHFFRPHS